jgi:hypothetical protein
MSMTFFQEKNNPRQMTSHNLQNGQFCCRTRAPPSASFGNISAKNQATKPALKPNWAPGFDAYCCRAPSPISPVRISTGIPSTGLCFFLSYHHHHGSWWWWYDYITPQSSRFGSPMQGKRERNWRRGEAL